MTNTTNLGTSFTPTQMSRWDAEGDIQAELLDAGLTHSEAEELVWRRQDVVDKVVEGRMTAKAAARRCQGRRR